MEMPVSYIILKMMEVLKYHNKETKVSLLQIERIIDNILESSIFTDNEKKEMLENFSLDDEIKQILANSIYFYNDEDDSIVMYPNINDDDFDYLIDSEKDYNKELTGKIDHFFDYNVPVLELLGIDIDKKLLNNIIELQGKIENEYDRLSRIEMDNRKLEDSDIHNLKLMSVKRNMAFSCMNGNLTSQEYEDMYSYNGYLTSFNNYNELPLKIKNDELHEFIINDPFHRSLFFLDDNKEFNLRDKFTPNVFMNNEERSKDKFYSKVINTINSRVIVPGNEEIINDLVSAKYRLMCSIDTIYGNFIFRNYRSDEKDFVPDYSFIKNEIYYFIDELLLYSDKDMLDITNTYNNTIKSILIEAYYVLTNDEEVIQRIKNHPNYGKQHFITYLLEKIINKPKKKIKEKEDK